MNIFKKEKLTKKNSFINDARCMTCGTDKELQIPKGKTPWNYCHKIKCEDCGNNEWRVTLY